MADDTIHVEEPREDNSGLTQVHAMPLPTKRDVDRRAVQGIFVKRHQIPKADGQPYSIDDIRVGEDVRFYGREIRVVDCDDFTRAYLKDNARYDVPEAIAYPANPIDIHRASRKKTDASDRRFDLEASTFSVCFQAFPQIHATIR